MRLGASIFADMMIEDGSREERVRTVAPVVATPTPAPVVSTPAPVVPTPTPVTQIYYTSPKPAPAAPSAPIIDTTPLPTNATSIATFNDSSPVSKDERIAPLVLTTNPYPWDATAMQQYVDTVITQTGTVAPVVTPPVVTPESPNPITGYPGAAAAIVTTATGQTPLSTTPTGVQTPAPVTLQSAWSQYGKSLVVFGLLALPLLLYGKGRQ